MLKRVESIAAVVACNTCRAAGEAAADGVPGGARLVAALRAVKAGDARYDGVAVQEMPCLFACADACTVHLRAPGKISYILGRFAPDRAAACAILDFAAHYVASEQGEVPFADWPQGVMGHFVTRAPPAGFVIED